jgi:HAD superfamily hydrolase (TIGR01549 family)
MDFLKNITHWIFDMDGTLTVPIHDFNEIRQKLCIAPEADIITAINSQKDLQEAEKMKQILREFEAGYAARAKKQPFIEDVLQKLQNKKYSLGVITRNTEEFTTATLQTTGLTSYFPPAHILTREFTPAKPDPAPIRYFLKKWQAPPNSTIMIGDYRHDIEAGRAAGVYTLYFDSAKTGSWSFLAHTSCHSWKDILKEI